MAALNQATEGILGEQRAIPGTFFIQDADPSDRLWSHCCGWSRVRDPACLRARSPRTRPKVDRSLNLSFAYLM
jgi:hypothetical protein